jgi:ribosomal protein S18 acetylase RimI-like enzyme
MTDETHDHLLVLRAEARHLDALVEGNAAMALETEGLALDRLRLRAGVGAVLDDPEKGFYLVAEGEVGARRGVLGQLMVTFEWSDWRNGVFLWIQSVYVWPEARRQGTYRRLYAELRRIATARGDVSGIRLYVERENRKAQATYAALGMKRAHYDMFEVDFVLERS